METTTVKKERVTSRIGDMPVVLPGGVTVEVKRADDLFAVTGPKGRLEDKLPANIEIRVEANQVIVVNASGLKKDKAYHGLVRALLANMVKGVTVGFQKTLLIEGVGYRAAVQGKNVEINVGYSNPVIYPMPEGITIDVENNTKVNVKGIDKCRVGQAAAEIRKIRPPEPYKGKGIRYSDEKVRKKVGKSGTK